MIAGDPVTIMYAFAARYATLVVAGPSLIRFKLDDNAELTTDNREGVTWLRGLHDLASDEVLAMRSAYALSDGPISATKSPK